MLDSSKLTNEIADKIKTKGFTITKENRDFIESFCEALLEHIKKNAVVETKGTAIAQTGTIK